MTAKFQSSLGRYEHAVVRTGEGCPFHEEGVDGKHILNP